MPAHEITVSCKTPKSFRVAQIAGMFDVTLESKQRETFAVEVPGLDEDWGIGVIVGPSGSGKSTVARHVFGEELYSPGDWPAGRAVIDCLGKADTKTITHTLTAVGLSSPPSWIKPYGVLSNGEKFRCDLARALLSDRPLIAFDEFTSVVDRNVAKIGSAAVSKALRKWIDRRFVAVTCHYDVVEWLEPDWVLDMRAGTLARGSTGTKAREQGAYCRPIQSSQTYMARFLADNTQTLSRYHTLNVTNIDTGRRPTVEFRAFAGTLNTTKIFGYVRLCLGLVEKAHTMKRCPKWTAKTPVETSPITRGGEGQTSLNRLFYFLGWTKGRESHTFGNVNCANGPTLAECKKELMRLATKYDAR